MLSQDDTQKRTKGGSAPDRCGLCISPHLKHCPLTHIINAETAEAEEAPVQSQEFTSKDGDAIEEP